jgi:nitroimidazol reductase NimA-like FMN-containing flavoprotein (pyridoxamine 5'-phosphate oxidase superfamily)/GNAT superfamily N-acetyltransferase
MAFGRIGEQLYLHGAVANALLAAPAGRELCVAATCLDGLVLAKSAFRHSMNYRSAMIYGRPREACGDEKARALVAILDHALPGRSAECRAPDEAELAATRVIAVDLAEASVKVRVGPPREAERDEHAPFWSGILPLRERAEPPVPSCDTALSEALIRATLSRAPRLEGDAAAGAVTISGDATRIDFRRTLSWLRDDAYWAADLDEGRWLRALQSSYVVGAYDAEGAQVGVARAVTDGETFGWLCDVYVARDARGRGIGRAMTRYLVEHPRFSRLRRWALGTHDAHGVYAPLGFTEASPGRFMVRRAALRQASRVAGGSHEEPCDTGRHEAGEHAGEHRARPERGEVPPALRREHTDAADLNGDRPDVGETA